jgi:hypothetical protein
MPTAQATYPEFFDTRHTQQLTLACNIVAYPFEFCLKPSNRQLIADVMPGRVDVFITALHDAQLKLRQSTHRLDHDQVWAAKDRILQSAPIKTAPLSPATWPNELNWLEFAEQLNLRLLDGVVDEVYRLKDRIDANGLPEQALVCIWLSDHLALLVLGIARLSYRAFDQRLLLQPSSESTKYHLSNMWFGSAFEEQSLRAASAAIAAFVASKLHPDTIEVDPSLLYAAVMSIFPQHWRLPADRGPVASLFEPYLGDIVQLLTNVLAAKAATVERPLSQAHAESMGLLNLFNLVVGMVQRQSPASRLFDWINGGLVSGDRVLARGMIEVAEEVAKQQLGKDWHAEVSSHQKTYLLERLQQNNDLDVLDFELNQHHTLDNAIPIDVDLWVRVKSLGVIYAIQLKHLESTKQGGITYWLGRTRDPTGGLGKGIAQLDNLKRLIDGDTSVQAHLLANGVKPKEMSHIYPILLHNVGTMDFWQLQEGILLYDLHTFCNALDSRAATVFHSEDHKISFHESSAKEPPTSAALHTPSSVIASYTKDPRFLALKYFDAAKHLHRSVQLPSCTVEAKGLGI